MKTLLDRLRYSASGNDGFMACETCAEAFDEVESLTAELADAQIAVQAAQSCTTHFSTLLETCEKERDAALAASRWETDLCKQALVEIERLQKQITEMREIGKMAFRAIVSASDVIYTLVPENDDEEARVFELQNQLHDVGMSLFTVCRLPDEDAQWVMERKRA